MLRTRYSGHWRGREAPGRAAVARTLTVLERCLGAEMSHHLGCAPGQAKPEGTSTNHRNGKGSKTVLTDAGALRIDLPRDREGSFEPRLIGKHERRFTGFDEKIFAMCARDMTVREIQGLRISVKLNAQFDDVNTNARQRQQRTGPPKQRR